MHSVVLSHNYELPAEAIHSDEMHFVEFHVNIHVVFVPNRSLDMHW